VWYLYADWTNDGHCFYVGKGNLARVKRPMRNTKHTRIATKYGLNRHVLWLSESETLIFKMEVALIELYKLNSYRHPGNKWACNFTNGGEGSSGRKLSLEAKSKIALTHQGKPKSESHKKKLSESQMSTNIRLGVVGGKRSPEVCANISRGLKGKRMSEATKDKIRNTKLGKKRGPYKKRKKAGVATDPCAD
jgi:hypothetical protein